VWAGEDRFHVAQDKPMAGLCKAYYNFRVPLTMDKFSTKRLLVSSESSFFLSLLLILYIIIVVD
jgi:hypothetical protein